MANIKISQLPNVSQNLTSNALIPIVSTNGTYTTDKVYGTLATPETGSILSDVTGAILGVTNILIHNSVTAPTFSLEYKKL